MACRITGLWNLAALILISAMAAPRLLAQNKPDLAYQLQKVKEWQTAAMQHAPGKPDSAAVSVGAWPSYDLESVIRFMTEIGGQPGSAAKRKLLGKGIYRRALDLTDREVQQGDLTRVLKRATLLHTDIALLELEKGDFQHKPGGIEGIGIFADGRVFFQPQQLHWQFARQLVEVMSKIPSQEELARQWYIATTAHMQSRRLLGYAGRNLKSAHERFPSDDRLLFYSGVLHETWALPINQNPILPRGVRISYGSTDSELRLARHFLEQAIQKNPAFHEARLRLGRVIGLLGNHRQAIAELQNASASIRDPQLSYYAALYLGCEFRMLSRLKEAREHYERAAALYPTAQSPLLALSQLALDSDDVEGALGTLKLVFVRPRNDQWNDDPWWIYDLAHVRDAGELVQKMRSIFGESSQ